MNRRIDRRELLKTVGQGAAALSLASTSSKCSSLGIKKPNIILVTMDTTRKDHLGCYGYNRPTSPNLDKLAEESLVFEDCYSTTNTTLSSHASILTGLYPHNHGVASNLSLFIKPRTQTLADILSRHKYKTAAITSVGFMNKNTIGNGFQGFYSPKGIEAIAKETTDLAIKLVHLLRQQDEPFFLWLHYWDPHFPYVPPKDHKKTFFEARIDQRRLEFVTEKIMAHKNIKDYESNLEQIALETSLTEEEQEAMLSMYDEEIAYMDHHVGRFLNALKENNLYDSSVIVFTADHGESFFENSQDYLAHLFIYEPVVRIPLIIRSPDLREKRIGGLVQNIDILPTVLNWLNLEVSLQIDGRDMNPLISNSQNIGEDMFLVAGGARMVGVVSDQYKMIRMTARRKEPLPIPQYWEEEIRALPRINLNNQPPPTWKYEETKGVIVYSWQHPSGCKGKIDRFCIELISEVLNPQTPSIVIYETRDTTEVIFDEILPVEQAWDKVSAHFPTYLRIVGKDKNGRNIAASDAIPFALDGPLGIERELYDLSTDPNEQHNMAKEELEIVRDLESKLRDFGEKNLKALEEGSQIVKDKAYAPRSRSEEEIQILRDLGYVH